ncbi:MAG: hypothetical protein IPM15_16585 [Betaproteobacteria bacterium]|nr:hypothetical protein [Betaproteobacteria bacterium]MCC6246406.1 hypothetical protein [Rubrivivax sp.]MCL4697874.1 hypothetical protein [Burkholderiaceae bacterium]
MKPFPVTDSAALDWTPQRRAARASDEALTGTARRWLRALPSRRRPIRLCQLYPRVANRLAWCWRDAELATQVLDDLLQDRRGGRAGFPAPVVRELQRLAEFNQQQRVDPHGDGWWTSFGRLAGLG